MLLGQLMLLKARTGPLHGGGIAQDMEMQWMEARNKFGL